MENCFKISFNPNPKVDITGEIAETYFIELYEYRNGIKEHITHMCIVTNNYSLNFREWYCDFQFDVFVWNEEKGLEKILEHRYNDFNKNVLINLDTNFLNESLIWLNYAINYKKIHNCILFIKSNFNDILKEEHHEDINFITEINQAEFYAIYNIGKYDTEYEWNKRFTGSLYNKIFENIEFCSFKNPRDWRYISINDVANDILGINNFEYQQNNLKIMTEQKKSYIRQLMFLNGSIQSQHSSIQNIMEMFKFMIPDSMDITLADIAEDVLNEIIPIYDKYFTEDEIKKLIDFYKSDIGQSYLKNMGNITIESMKVGEKTAQLIQERIKKIQQDKASQEVTDELTHWEENKGTAEV